MLASKRLLEIEEKFEATVERIVPVELDEETLRVVLYLKDGTNLRVTEQWAGKVGKVKFLSDIVTTGSIVPMN